MLSYLRSLKVLHIPILSKLLLFKLSFRETVVQEPLKEGCHGGQEILNQLICSDLIVYVDVPQNKKPGGLQLHIRDQVSQLQQEVSGLVHQ